MTRWKWSVLKRKFRKFAGDKQLRGKTQDGGRRLGVVQLEDRTVPSGFNSNETIDSTLTPTQLAQSLVGPGVEVSQVSFTGNLAATGSFDFSDPTVVGFDKGIILSSGTAADVVGPNLSDSTSTDFVNPGDADLNTLSGFNTFDAAVLEFDFVPTANQVVFNYTFASDEYPEWVTTPYNDVFAFFVNGTNYAEVRQIAGDPASPFVPVAVNNINNGNPLYPDAIAMRPDLFRANYFDPNGGPSAIDLELDGITRVLTFQAPVVAGQVNHMKLAIADASDGIYDSAVFIQAGSLVSNENPVADLSLSPSTGAAPLAVTAFIEGEDPNGLALTYTIDWGDGTVSSGPLDQPSTDSEKTASIGHTYAAAGSYIATLTVSNGTLSGTSSEDVDVTSAGNSVPFVTGNPSDQTVYEGDLFTFTASASGVPAPTVQWQISTDSGVTFTDIAGATQTTYSAAAALADNGSLFHAVFTNSEGSATTTAALLTVMPVDHTPPAAPGVALTEDTGVSATDLITQNGSLTLSNIESGATVEYSIDNGVTWTGSFNAAEGSNAILVHQTDAAGNVSDATAFGFTLDTMIAAPDVALTQDTGVSASDKITSIGTLTLTGVETGALVEYSIDNGTTWNNSFVAQEGVNAVLVRQTDLAGNVSGVATLSFTLDTTAPTLNPTFSSTPPFLVGATGITVSANASDAYGIASEFGGVVDTTTAGQKFVTSTATDLAGNTASVDTPYIVGYRAINVKPLAGTTYKRRATIPVSFQLADANGLISDQAAASLLPNVSVSFSGQSPARVSYNKKTNTFSANLKTTKTMAGAYDILIRVTMGGVDVTTVVIPITVA